MLASISLLVVLMLLMKWLLESQVAAAAQRHAQERALRAATARCFELKSRSATNACLKELETKDKSAIEPEASP